MGQDVFKHAVEKLAAGLDQAIRQAGLQANDIDWLVPHQANIRIINMLQRKLNMSDKKVIRTVDRHANTSAASIPLAFAVHRCKKANSLVIFHDVMISVCHAKSEHMTSDNSASYFLCFQLWWCWKTK